MVLGCDISPEYQRDFDVVQAHKEGMQFIAVKLSDSLKGTERYEDGIRVCRQAQSLGMVAFGYHFLRSGFMVGPDAHMFAQQLKRAGVPGCIDWESTTGSSPNIEELRSLTGEVWANGARLCCTYAPRWYWQSQGSPSLAGLPPLWSSRYVATNGVEVSGTPAFIAGLITLEWWNGYGGRPIRILQFSRKASVAGLIMDVDIYRGPITDLEIDVYG